MTFAQKFGKEKDELFDELLDMTADQVQHQCSQYGLPVVEKQI